jgi:hypothetical protein
MYLDTFLGVDIPPNFRTIKATDPSSPLQAFFQSTWNRPFATVFTTAPETGALSCVNPQSFLDSDHISAKALSHIPVRPEYLGAILAALFRSRNIRRCIGLPVIVNQPTNDALRDCLQQLDWNTRNEVVFFDGIDLITDPADGVPLLSHVLRFLTALDAHSQVLIFSKSYSLFVSSRAFRLSGAVGAAAFSFLRMVCLKAMFSIYTSPRASHEGFP